jgi:peptidoglycan/LPS O-acetylase OafA/YrhL
VSKRISQLDAVRGLAILVVIVHNQRDQFASLHLQRLFASGWMGVDLFFVLSGFLITGILLDNTGSQDYFKNFYARRCLRIWPLFYCVLFVMFVVLPLLRPAEGHAIFERSSPWWAYPLFVQNFLIPVPTNAAGPLAVSWSLAVEEQFYLVWPWFVRYCSRAQLRCVAISVICISPLLRLFLAAHNVNLYSNTFCRLDGLMAGAVLALAVRSPRSSPSELVSGAWLALLVVGPLALVAESLGARWIVFSLSAGASAAFVYLALNCQQKWFRLVMTNRFLVYTGTTSYGLYLLHKLPFDLARAFHWNGHAWLTAPILLAVCYATAALSRNLLEEPFLRLKRFFEPKSLRQRTSEAPAMLAC